MMNWRSRLTGICTGDQAIFVTRSAFERLAGFAPIALMEDVEFSKRAKVAFLAGCDQHTCCDIGPALATAWYLAHDRSDVALSSCVLFRRRSAAAGTALSRCSLSSRLCTRERDETAAARRRRAGARARVARPWHGAGSPTWTLFCYAVEPVAIQRHVAGLDCRPLPTEELTIDLAPLAQAAGAQLISAHVENSTSPTESPLPTAAKRSPSTCCRSPPAPRSTPTRSPVRANMHFRCAHSGDSSPAGNTSCSAPNGARTVSLNRDRRRRRRGGNRTGRSLPRTHDAIRRCTYSCSPAACRFCPVTEIVRVR